MRIRTNNIVNEDDVIVLTFDICMKMLNLMNQPIEHKLIPLMAQPKLILK